MKKIDAINIINNHDSTSKLSTRNTHWANISKYKEERGWWLNIPFNKFKNDLNLIINDLDLGKYIHLKVLANSIKNPQKIFRNKDDTADIFIKSENEFNLSTTDNFIDIQSNGTEYNFSSHVVNLYEHSLLTTNKGTYFPDEVSNTLIEGLKKSITVNYYERNTKARNACIKAHGYNCTVCDFNFEKSYGARGKDYIHVHHLKAISDIGEKYVIVPEKDLKPVCPNCHAMLHRKGNISIEELLSENKSLKILD